MSKKKNEYNGCIRSIEQVRDFARESFVYGIKDKSNHTEMCPRAYDLVTRQMGDWFKECLHTKTVKVRNKVKYISLNCRDYSVNPLYKIWKTCSFTTNEIVFFFFILNYLSGKTKAASLTEIHKDYYGINRTDVFQKGSAQKWLNNKGCPSGIFIKDDKNNYRLAQTYDFSNIKDLLSYYSEIAPAGVVGSFILDKQEKYDSPFRFKQHYISQAFDFEIMCNILYAIKTNRLIAINYYTKNHEEINTYVFPLKVYSSTQNGRQYLIAWDEKNDNYYNYRLDRIKSVDISIYATTTPEAKSIREKFEDIRKHIWGVSFIKGKLVHVDILIKVDENEAYIINRLNREKRCGTVSTDKKHHDYIRFEADVYDAHEMFPWIRTFLCRIVELKMSDHELEELFWGEFNDMCAIYSVGKEQS